MIAPRVAGAHLPSPPCVLALLVLLLASGACAAPAAPAAGAATGTPGGPGGSPPAAPSPIPVSLALPSPGLNSLAYYFGQANGLYAAEGVDLDLQVLPANTGIAAVLAGQVDFTSAAGSAARAAATGSPLRVVMGLIDQSDLSLLGTRDIATVRDLRDKTIAITSVAGSPAQIGRRVIQSAGLNPDTDVAFVQTQTPPQTFAALAAGGVPAAVLSPPYVGMAERAGFHVVARGRDYIRSTQGGLATTQDRIATDREKVARTIRGTLRAIAYTLDHEDELVEFVATKWELEPDDARLTYREVMEGLVRDGQTALDIIGGELELAGETATADQVVDYTILKAVLDEPSFRATCAASGSTRPKGCRTS